MKRTYPRRYSRNDKAMIVAEYEAGILSRQEIAKKYGIKNDSLISVWKCRLHKQEKYVSLQPETRIPQISDKAKTTEDMEKKQYKSESEELVALRQKLSELQSQFDWEKKRSLALQTLIDIAEENGLHVKKCGAKQ